MDIESYILGRKSAGGGGGGGADAPIVYCPLEVVSQQGGGNAYQLQLTWQEIHDAMVAGKLVFVYRIENASDGVNETWILSACGSNSATTGKYYVSGANITEDYAYNVSFYADTANDYPVY